VSSCRLREGKGETELGFETTKRKLGISSSDSASYLMVGGLGGTGRAVLTWTVDHSARELIFISRSVRITNKDDAFVDRL
jgi:hypothetical protein